MSHIAVYDCTVPVQDYSGITESQTKEVFKGFCPILWFYLLLIYSEVGTVYFSLKRGGGVDREETCSQ